MHRLRIGNIVHNIFPSADIAHWCLGELNELIIQPARPKVKAIPTIYNTQLLSNLHLPRPHWYHELRKRIDNVTTKETHNTTVVNKWNAWILDTPHDGPLIRRTKTKHLKSIFNMTVACRHPSTKIDEIVIQWPGSWPWISSPSTPSCPSTVSVWVKNIAKPSRCSDAWRLLLLTRGEKILSKPSVWLQPLSIDLRGKYIDNA
jgi:hypothetical protein